jgi:oligopeptide transport system ATP-binding protein
MTNGDILLKVKDLKVSFRTGGGEVQAVRDVSFDLYGGETLAIVGESASGKSVTAKSIMRLLPADTSEIKGGEVIFGDRDLLKISEKEMEGVRGRKIAMIFQDPMTSLDPTMKVGRQITEALGKHLKLSRSGANKRAVELLQMVGIPNADERVKQYPHQFSGGMRQRVVIAIALACEPDIIIADEPTTALDVTIQAQILDLLRDLQERKGTSIVLITHDLGVVANTAHRVAVMYSGRLIETGTVREIFYSPKHPYTWGLLTSVPLATSDGSQELIPIQGSPPDPLDPPKACPFAARCPHTMKICVEDMPEFTDFTGQHRAACWLHHEMAPHVEPPARVGEAK